MSREQYPASAQAPDLTSDRARARRRVLARFAPAVAGVGLAVLLVGCGAGQITQTGRQQSEVNGSSGQVGAISIRNAELKFPNNAQGVYPPGSSATLIVTIINTGILKDQLVSVSSPAATGVTIDGSPTGTKALPGNFSISSGVDVDDSTAAVLVPSTSSSPTSTSRTPTSSTPTSSTSTTATSTSGKSSSTHGVPSGLSTAPTTTSARAMPPGSVEIVLTGIRTINGHSLRAGLTIPITFTFARAGQVTLQQVPIAAPADSLRLDTTSRQPSGANS